MSKKRIARHISKMLKKRTVWSSDVEKLHAAVARSTFPSQNVQNIAFSDNFFEVPMLKTDTPLWRQARFTSQNAQTTCVWSTFGGFDVAKVSDRRDR